MADSSVEKGVQSALSKILDRIGGLESRFDAIDGRLDKFDLRFDEIDVRLNSMSEGIAWCKMNIGMIAHSQAGIAAGVDHCRAQLSDKDVRLNRLESTIGRLVEESGLPDSTQ